MWTRTNTALLEGLAGPENHALWHEFDARFRPVLLRFALRLGLSPEDAADAAQETLSRFLRSFQAGKYDRSRGRLSSWILGIARHCILDVRQGHQARREHRGMSAIEDLPDNETLTDLFDQECQRELLARAMDKLRLEGKSDEKTLEAFELVMRGDHSPSDVAAELNMSCNDVYLAKHRCLKRLRVILDELKRLYEID